VSVCLVVVLLRGKGVRVNMPFINTFQKKKDFLSANSAKDMEVANTYLSEFHFGSQWHAF
jgi:hypothetical protein